MDCICDSKKEEKLCMEIVPIFNSLDYHEMMEIAKIIDSREYKKGEMIYMTGDRGEKVFVIRKGKVKITRLSDLGREQVIRLLGAGDFMGELSLFTSSNMTDNAEALEDTSICTINGVQLKGLMVKYPTIGLKVLEELSTRLEKAEKLIEHLGIHDVETRIANAILDMAEGKKELVLKMSKRDLASHIGMSQETLSRKLSYFQELNIIKLIGHRRIVILDEDALRSIA